MFFESQVWQRNTICLPRLCPSLWCHKSTLAAPPLQWAQSKTCIREGEGSLAVSDSYIHHSTWWSSSVQLEEQERKHVDWRGTLSLIAALSTAICWWRKGAFHWKTRSHSLGYRVLKFMLDIRNYDNSLASRCSLSSCCGAFDHLTFISTQTLRWDCLV